MGETTDVRRDHRYAPTRCTVYPLLEIIELKPQRSTGVLRMRATVHNQKSELVLEGGHAYLLKKRPTS
jgi:acyl dehydratase